MSKIKNLEVNYDMLSDEKKHDLYLRKLATGEIQGPPTGKPSQDKPWLKYYSEEAIASDVPSMSIYDYVKLNNKDNFEIKALNFFGLEVTYKTFFSKVDKVVECLKKIGVRENDIVIINSVTFPQCVYLLYALNKIGAIANLTDVRTDSNGMKHYINEGKSKFIFTLDSVYGNIKPIINDTGISKVILLSPTDIVPFPFKIINNVKEHMLMPNDERLKEREKKKKLKNDKKNDIRIINWKEFMKTKNSRENTNFSTFSYSYNHPAAIVHTSGTTGKPKSVVLTNENFNSITHQYSVSDFNFNPGDTLLNIVPMFTAYGAVNSLHMPLSLGITDIVYPKVVGEDFTDIIMKFKPNHVIAVPLHWEILMNDKKMKNFDLGFLKTAACGGDKVPEELEMRINKFLKSHNCKSNLVIGYGMTELSACATTNSNESTLPGSVGIPLVNNNIKIINPDTNEELLINQSGEICISSPSMMLKYLNDEEETEKTIRIHDDGKCWIHTGDLGHVTDDGHLVIDGRLKRLIIRRGFKISAVAIENILLKSSHVISCAVAKAKDDEDGEVPFAFVCIDDKENCDEILDELNRLCTENLPDYSYPKKIEIIDTIPYTNNNKVDFNLLEERANNLNSSSNLKVKIKR